MKRKLLITLLAMAVVFAFTAMPGFAASKQVVQTSYEYYSIDQDGNEVLGNSNEKTYDSKGRVTKIVSKNKGKLEDIVTYSYKNGKLITETYKGAGENKGVKSKWKHYYDKKSRQSKSIFYEYRNGKYRKSSISTSKYTSKKITIIDKGVDGEVYSKLVRSLDSKGRVIKEVSYFRGKDKDRTIKREYWNNGNVKKETTIDENNPSHPVVDHYNKKGLLTKIENDYYDADLDLFVKSTMKYEYNTNDLLIKMVEKNTWTSEGKTHKSSITYTYKYSNWYGKTKKYPKTTKCYEDGKLIYIQKMTYKKI